MTKSKEDFLKDVNFKVPMDVFKRELLKKANGDLVLRSIYCRNTKN